MTATWGVSQGALRVSDMTKGTIEFERDFDRIIGADDDFLIEVKISWSGDNKGMGGPVKILQNTGIVD